MRFARPLWVRIRSARHAAVGSDAASGVILIVMAAVAIAAANSSLATGYHALFHGTLAGPIALLPDVQSWVNEAAMAVFFFTVGLEIKREALIGDLATPARRRLPILAATAGMIVPALIYLGGTGGRPQLAAGWAIPTSTDIAFAVGVLGLIAGRLPASLRLFLLSVAVVDDLGAVTIIALVYHAQTSGAWLAASGTVLGALVLLNRGGGRRGAAYVALSLLLWFCVLHSGVHPSIAGVAAALTVPLDKGLLLRWERTLAPWCAWLILPLFALANAGVALRGGIAALVQPLPLAIAAGLVIGKQLGIFGAVVLAERLGLAHRPHGANWAQVWGVSVLAGIGFTMSLFIAALAFPAAPQLAESAKLGVLGGSALSAVAGYAILRLASKRH